MKNNVWTVLLFTTALSACTKEQNSIPLAEDNGCIERIIVPVNAHSINASDIPVANALFADNGIDNSKYRYYRYVHDSTQTRYPPYAKFDTKVVQVDEYTNGLRIFTGQLGFVFKNDVIDYKSDQPTNGTTLDTTTNLSLAQLRKLFIDNIEQFDHKGSQYKDSCLKAEFGYYDLNSGTSYSTENLIKAWRITLKGSLYPFEYPISYYQDGDGKLICYDNGIRTIK